MQSETDDYSDWQLHLKVHNKIKELLSICAWRDLTYSDLLVSKNDDYLYTESGQCIGPCQWHPVSSYFPKVDRQQKYEHQHFLFSREDLSLD